MSGSKLKKLINNLSCENPLAMKDLNDCCIKADCDWQSYYNNVLLINANYMPVHNNRVNISIDGPCEDTIHRVAKILVFDVRHKSL